MTSGSSGFSTSNEATKPRSRPRVNSPSRSNGVLDLDGVQPPGVPRRSSVMLGFRVPPSVAAWVRDQADKDRIAPAAFLQRIVEQSMNTERFPADVRAWLIVQAAQCGCVGDPEAALVAVVRHLAALWPQGARLGAVTAPSTSEQLRHAKAQVERLKDANARLRAQLKNRPS